MARAIWSGIISFGLVSIPVKLYAATESHAIAFHQLHKKCKTQIKELRWCPTCEKAVDWKDIQKGYEYAKGEYIAITPEDLEKLPLPNKQTIAIQAFVDQDDIDPIYFERAYYLEPDEKTFRPFALFMKVLKQKKMSGVATIAFRNKERLCSVRAAEGTLVLNTLLYPDEIREQPKISISKVNLSAQETNMANKLVDMMAQSFQPKDYKDHYLIALQKLIDAKLNGKEVTQPPQPKKKVYDLMEALKASVKGKGHREKKATHRTTKRPKRLKNLRKAS